MIQDTLRRRGFTDDELLRLFKSAQRELIEIIENLQGDFRSFRTAQKIEIERVIRRLEQRTAKWAEEEIGSLVRAGSEETLKLMPDEDDFAFQFAGIPEKTVSLLTTEAALEFGNTMVGLRRNATRALLNKRKLQEKIVESVIQGSSVARTQKQLIDVLRRDGIEVLRARNGFGRRFSLQDYTNLLVRSQSMSAYNTGAKLTMLGTGRRFAKIPTIRPDVDGDDVCNKYERQVYIDLTKPEQVPPYHPRCRHVPIPVSFAELKANRPDLYRLAVGYYQKEN